MESDRISIEDKAQQSEDFGHNNGTSPTRVAPAQSHRPTPPPRPDQKAGREHEHEHIHGVSSRLIRNLSAALLLFGFCLIMDWQGAWGRESWVRIVGYLLSFIPLGIPVLREAIEITREGTFLNECTLMFTASIGAFAIGEYPEAVLLMALYTIGELFEGRAVQSARKSITSLIDSRSDQVQVLTEQGYELFDTEDVPVGAVILVQSGDIVPLDGWLLGDQPRELDLSALTGESMPVAKAPGDEVLAGSVCRESSFQLKVMKRFSESTLSRIMRMSEEAALEKPKTEQFIRRFAKVYTPIVFTLAVLITTLPYLILGELYNFEVYLYLGLVFLVTSCPCALMLSVPLSYFGGIGAASRNGLLFKGAIHLEVLRKVDAVVFDKTGTLTQGNFEHLEIEICDQTWGRTELLSVVKALEQHSAHPIAQAIVKSLSEVVPVDLSEVRELPGRGMTANYGSEKLCLGNLSLMKECGIVVNTESTHPGKTVLYLGRGERLAAKVLLSDALKPTSRETIDHLHQRGIKEIVMLSGDKADVVQQVARDLDLDDAMGDLLPDDKIQEVRTLMQKYTVAYVGDGLNDAPVMSMVPVGIAMGKLGSDATIEAADVIIQRDDPRSLVDALDLAKKTHQIVIQNITFSLAFKWGVMVLAVLGYASLSLAIIADVGVTILAVLNATRILRFRGLNSRATT